MDFYIFVRSLFVWLFGLLLVAVVIASYVFSFTPGEVVASAVGVMSLALLYDVLLVRPTRRGRS